MESKKIRLGRLVREADFKSLRFKGRKFPITGSLLALVLIGGTPEIRLGFAFSRKNGSAVQRNLLRRRIKQGLRTLLKEEFAAPGVVPGFDVVFLCRGQIDGNIEQFSYLQICKGLQIFIRKLKGS